MAVQVPVSLTGQLYFLHNVSHLNITFIIDILHALRFIIIENVGIGAEQSQHVPIIYAPNIDICT